MQIVNDEFLNHVRAGRCEYIRGDVQRLTADGVKVNARMRGTKPGDEGKPQFVSSILLEIKLLD